MFHERAVAEPLQRHVEVDGEDHQVARARVRVVVYPVRDRAAITLQILGNFADLATSGLDGLADAVAPSPDRNARPCVNAHAMSIAYPQDKGKN